MATTAIERSPPRGSITAARRRLGLAATGWFIATLIGQALFLAYIIGFYAPPVATGDIAAWSRNKGVIDAYVAGDTMGNLQFGIHILMAAILTFGGILQLWPALRRRAAGFHRWNGRVFVAAAGVAAIGGLWLVWVRGSRLGWASAIGITLNALFILLFVALAWRAARERDFASHQRWATRAFLVVNGVWFLRVGMMAFALIGIGALGLPRSLAQDFFALWSFGSTLVPLLVYELYLRARTAHGPTPAHAMAGGLAVLTLAMALGVAGAALMMWAPALRAAGVLG